MIPAVQQAAADFALNKLQPKLKTEASIGKIRIKLFNKVQLEEVYLEDRTQDTLLYVEKLQVRLNPWNLLDNTLSVESVKLEDFTAKVNRETPDKPFNFQFLIDAFAGDTLKPKEPSKKPPLAISIRNVQLKNGTLRYDIQSAPETPNQFNSEHIFVKNLQAKANLPSIDMERLEADIEMLSFWEHSGITVKNFEAMVRSKGKKLWSKKINVMLNNSNLDVSSAIYNIETKEFSLTAKSKTIDPKDAAIFSLQLMHLDKPFRFEADMEGRLPYVSVKNLTASYGNSTKVKIKGLISNYNQYGDADINIDVSPLSFSQDDLLAFLHIGNPDIKLPDQVAALGNIDVSLKAKGKLSRFNLNAFIKSNPGNVKITGVGNADKKIENYSFSGKLITNKLKLAQIIGQESNVNDLTMDGNVTLVQTKNKPLRVDIDGNVISVLYNNHTFNDIQIQGTYADNNIDTKIRTHTTQNKLALQANIVQGKAMQVDISGTIDKLLLTPFYSASHWRNANLTARIDGHFSGNNIDNMTGNLVIDSTSLYDENFIYNPGAIYLQATADSADRKKIQLHSSFLEGEIAGDYHFSSIDKELLRILHTHFSSVVQSSEDTKSIDGKNNFRFEFLLKNTEDFSYAFNLPLYNVEPAKINGYIDFTQGEVSVIETFFPRLMMGQNDIRQSKINIRLQETVGVDANINSYLVQDNGYVNVRLNSEAKKDSVANQLFFDVHNNIAKSNGTLDIDIGFDRSENELLITKALINPATIFFNQKNIHIQQAAIRQTGDKIKIDNFGIIDNGVQKFGIDGVASENIRDSVRIFFKETEVTSILSAFNVQNINGLLHGEIIIQNALKNPLIHTNDFKIENLSAYNDTIGTMYVESNLNMEKKGIDLNAFIEKKGLKHSEVRGFIPTGEEKNIDLNVNLKELPLSWIQPFANEAFSELSGTMSSKIFVSGKLNEPIAQGWLGVDKGLMRVDYTNVTYTISDTIRVNRDNVGFKNLIITDDNGQTASVSLELKHSNFGKMSYNTNITLDNFLVLNNKERTDLMAYGVLRLNGNIALNGSSDGLYGEMELQNGPNSNVMIELPQTATASKNHGVIYINTPQEKDSLSFLRRRKEQSLRSRQIASSMPINIRMRLNLDPELSMGALIDPVSGNAIEISGNGKIRLDYNSKADPSIIMYGDYVAEEGKAHLNLQNLKTVDFRIHQGSTVTFTGDPIRTRFNIAAYNQVKADLTTLSQSFSDDSNLSSTRVPINALLEIKGNMDKMDLYYDIELPDASQDVKQKVHSLIATEEQRIRQFAYLITAGSFYTSSGTPDMLFSGNRFTNMATKLLSNGLDALFASALNDNWSISTNLETKNGDFENVRFGVDVSTKLLDDKLRLSTNLSYGENSTMADQQAFMGEFDAEYDLNTWLMLRAYNRANERYYKRAPYTQGVGIVINKEAHRLRDLFKFLFPKKTEKK